MPKTRLCDWAREIRKAAGYGEPRRAAAFARLIGISPPSLHDIESGQTKNIAKAWAGYMKIGANPHYLATGKGEPMLKVPGVDPRADAVAVAFKRLTEDQKTLVEELVKQLRGDDDLSGPPDGGHFRIGPPKGPQ